MVSEQQCAYYAGYFDGEGCVSIHYASKTRADKSGRRMLFLQATISSTDAVVLAELVRDFGGTIRPNHAHTKAFPTYKPIMSWLISARQAGRFLDAIATFTRIKAPQIAVARAFQARVEQTGKRRVTDEDYARRVEMRHRLRELKKLGVHGAYYAIQANSVKAAMAKTELNASRVSDAKCVETKRLRQLTQPFCVGSQEIVHPDEN